MSNTHPSVSPTQRQHVLPHYRRRSSHSPTGNQKSAVKDILNDSSMSGLSGKDPRIGFRNGLDRIRHSIGGFNISRLHRPTPNTFLLLILGALAYHILLHLPSSSRSPSFLVRPPHLPLPPPPPHPHYPTAEIEERWLKKGRVVPKVVHYVYGLKDVPEGEEGEEFPYYAYLAVRSVVVNVKPDTIYFHYANLPTGPWFNLLLPHLKLIKAIVPTHIMGNRLDHFAHQADVIRLEAMQYTGGIYIDIDTYILRPLDDLLYHPMTLGMEASPDSRRGPLDPTGLCNAVIISAPHSSFVERWRASYETFSPGEWAEHSVEMPWTIARRYPSEIQVLSTRAFFWPMWHGNEIQKVHELDEWDFEASGQYAYHSWESLAMQYLKELSPKRIREGNTSFLKMLRPFIGEEDDEVYGRWKLK